MTIHWTTEKLGNIVSHKKGFAFKSEWFQSSGVPVIKVTNFTDSSVDLCNLEYVSNSVATETRDYKLARGDVIIQTVGSWPNNPQSVVGKVVRVPELLDGALLNQNAVILRSKSKIRNDYLFYLLKDPSFKGFIINTAQGAANQASITLESLFRYEFLLPPLETQEKIVAILSAYNDLIGNNQRRIALLEKMAEEIYREWFVRLRFPGYEKVKTIKGVPEGWSFDKASKFFSLAKGKSYAAEELTDDRGQMPFINLKSFNRGGGYREDGLKYYSGRYKSEQVVYQNDVVMAVTDMTQDRAVIGRVARMPELGEKGAVISLDTVKLVPKDIHKTFLYAYMRHSGFANLIKEFANGANVLHLKPDLITQQKIIIPPIQLQNKFVPIAEPLYAEADLLGKANTQLVKMRDMLLPRLISGKLSVEHLDIRFPPGMEETICA